MLNSVYNHRTFSLQLVHLSFSYKAFLENTPMHPLENFMDYATVTIFLYNMGALCNMKSALCDTLLVKTSSTKNFDAKNFRHLLKNSSLFANEILCQGF